MQLSDSGVLSLTEPGGAERRVPLADVDGVSVDFAGGKATFHLRAGGPVVADGADGPLLGVVVGVWARLRADPGSVGELVRLRDRLREAVVASGPAGVGLGDLAARLAAGPEEVAVCVGWLGGVVAVVHGVARAV
jgi:hypothetical protein